MWQTITNRHRRPVIDGYELTADERKEFDYIDWAGVDGGTESASFVRYKGDLIDLGDVMRAEGSIAEAGWDGFNPDSFFSGIAIKYTDDGTGGDPYGYVIVALLIAVDD